MRMPLFFWGSVMTLLLAPSVRAHDDHNPSLLGAIYPQISPDGESLVFAHQGAIWRIGRAGGVMRRLTHGEGYDCWPSWSPDGKRIAFVNGRQSPAGPLRLMRAADGQRIAVPGNTAAKHKLCFSSDGARLLGLFRQGGGRYTLCWLDLGSGRLGEKIYEDTAGLRYDLSQDGKTIALATTQDLAGEQSGNNGPQCDLWTIPAQGGTPAKISRFPGRVYDVAWNADGRSIIVVSNVGGAHNDLWQVSLQNPLNPRKLTFGQADEDAPSVDGRGRWLVYTDNRRGPTAIAVRDNRTGRNHIATVAGRDFDTPTGRLRLDLRDGKGGPRVTARVTIKERGGKYHAPAAGIYRMLRGDLHFYCRGATSLELPAGEYSIKVSRGPEYLVTREKVVVLAKDEVRKTIELQRWTNQRARQWYSGESHIHANYGYGEWYNSPRTMMAQSAGEDLVVSNLVVANSDSDGVFDREFFRGRPDPLSTKDTILYWNQEFRSTIWGHLTLLNLKQLVEPIFTGFAHTTNPHDHPTNADIADHVHDQHGHVNYTHPAQNIKDPYLSAYSAKALPLDVALGKVDSIDVMGSNQVANMSVWYRLLNCGFRIPAAAGTDCFLNRIRSRLPGQVRVYVHVDGEFTYQRWVQSLKAGRTFVTDGPMFEFSVDKQMAGSTIQLDKPGQVRVRGRIRSHHPLNRVEIVSNGEVAFQAETPPGCLDVTIDRMLPIAHTGWIALRAAGPAQADQPTGGLFGHTSPVYVTVRGRRRDASQDARYFIQWIDRLRKDIRQRNRIPARHQVHVESQIAGAREVFNKILSTTR